MSTGFDAWNSPGWTSQHPVYLAAQLDLPLPAGVAPCLITGTYLSASGKGYYGTVTLRPSIPRTLIDQAQVLLAPVRADVTKGRLSALIYSLPQDVVWSVTEAVGPSRQAYDVIVPANSAGADLTALQKVT